MLSAWDSIDGQHVDLKRRNSGRQYHTVFIIALFDGRRNGPAHANPVTAHDHELFLPFFIEIMLAFIALLYFKPSLNMCPTSIPLVDVSLPSQRGHLSPATATFMSQKPFTAKSSILNINDMDIAFVAANNKIFHEHNITICIEGN